MRREDDRAASAVNDHEHRLAGSTSRTIAGHHESRGIANGRSVLVRGHRHLKDGSAGVAGAVTHSKQDGIDTPVPAFVAFCRQVNCLAACSNRNVGETTVATWVGRFVTGHLFDHRILDTQGVAGTADAFNHLSRRYSDNLVVGWLEDDYSCIQRQCAEGARE